MCCAKSRWRYLWKRWMQYVAASKETGKYAMEALMYRHHPQSLMIEKWIEEGRIGELQSIRGVFNFVLDHPG